MARRVEAFDFAGEVGLDASSVGQEHSVAINRSISGGIT
jgi:hypothetical protein